MTVVNPKSISGINSITMASGSDNLLTIHANDTSEKVRVNSSGDVIVGSGVTLSPDGDIFATGITTVSGNVKVGTGITLSPDGDIFFTGIATGNGSGLTNLATDLVNDTSPQLGGDLDTNTKNIKLGDSASHGASGDDTLIFGADDDMRMYHDGSNAYISNNTGAFVIQDSHAGANAVIIRKGAEVELLHNNVLACETSANGLAFPSGKGIDFSATGDASGSSSELLDDYEEGTWTPTLIAGNPVPSVNSIASARYTKVGRLVTVQTYFSANNTSSNTDTLTIGGLPFTAANAQQYYYGSGRLGSQDRCVPQVDANSNQIVIYNTGSAAHVVNAVLNTVILFSITYEAT